MPPGAPASFVTIQRAPTMRSVAKVIAGGHGACMPQPAGPYLAPRRDVPLAWKRAGLALGVRRPKAQLPRTRERGRVGQDARVEPRDEVGQCRKRREVLAAGREQDTSLGSREKAHGSRGVSNFDDAGTRVVRKRTVLDILARGRAQQAQVPHTDALRRCADVRAGLGGIRVRRVDDGVEAPGKHRLHGSLGKAAGTDIDAREAFQQLGTVLGRDKGRRPPSGSAEQPAELVPLRRARKQGEPRVVQVPHRSSPVQAFRGSAPGRVSM